MRIHFPETPIGGGLFIRDACLDFAVAEALGKKVSYTTKNGLTDKVYIEL